MRTIIIKNNTSEEKTWIKTFSPYEEYQIPSNNPALIDEYSSNDNFLISIANNEASIGNGDIYFSTVNDQINWLKGDYSETKIISGTITPTAPKNEYNLRPYGMVHSHINSSTHISTITLSNKNNNIYTYSSLNTPEYYDCIWSNHSVYRDGVNNVDTESHQITMFNDTLPEGICKLSKPINIDFLFPNEYSIYSMWGAYVSVNDYGDDDVVRLQIIDDTGVGISLGYYTQEEFNAAGGLVVLKEYDECWVRQLDKLGQLLSPDGSPAVIPAGLKARAKYYCKDETKIDIKIWIDYIISVKDEDL